MLEQLKPIAIYDSGLGGLSIAKTLIKSFPSERIIYFGDTQYSDITDRSPEIIKDRASKVFEYLLKQESKIILIVCETISAFLSTGSITISDKNTRILNIVDPVIEFVSRSDYKNIGIIGSRNTIISNAYDEKIRLKNRAMIVSSKATPLLQPMIEEGNIYDEIGNTILTSYLSSHDLRDIEALILANTTYPALKNQLNKFYNFEVDIIDPAQIIIDLLKKTLTENNLLSNSGEIKENRFLSTDLTLHHQVVSKMFYEKEIALEMINL